MFCDSASIGNSLKENEFAYVLLNWSGQQMTSCILYMSTAYVLYVTSYDLGVTMASKMLYRTRYSDD